jgi:branched-chain amino acid transport system substrate-binding protein
VRRREVVGIRASAVLLVAVLLFVFSDGSRESASPPLKVGVLSDCEGVWAAFYDYTLAGAELALIEKGAVARGTSPTAGLAGAAIAGHPVQLSFGCADGTPASVLREARRLVEQVGAQVLIGPLNGNEELALQEYATQRPQTTFVNGSASIQLTHPAPNFFSFHTDGAQWNAGLGAYAYRTLGWRTAVTITNGGDVFYWDQSAAFIAEFCSLGGRIVKRIQVQPGAIDFSAVTASLPPAPPSGLFFATDSNAVVSLARAVPALAGNISKKVLAGITAFGPQLTTLGARIDGMIIPDRDGPGYVLASRPYQRALRRAFPQLDPTESGVFDADYFAAMTATIAALTADGGDLSGGEVRFQHALAHVALDLPNGHVTLNARHQAIAPNYLTRLTGPNLADKKLIRAIPAVEATFGAYFTAHDPPPSPVTPHCSRGAVAPWARSH